MGSPPLSVTTRSPTWGTEGPEFRSRRYCRRASTHDPLRRPSRLGELIDNLAIRECLIRVARLAVGSPAQRAEYQVGHQVAEVQLPRDGHGVVAIDDELAAFDLEYLDMTCRARGTRRSPTGRIDFARRRRASGSSSRLRSDARRRSRDRHRKELPLRKMPPGRCRRKSPASVRPPASWVDRPAPPMSDDDISHETTPPRNDQERN